MEQGIWGRILIDGRMGWCRIYAYARKMEGNGISALNWAYGIAVLACYYAYGIHILEL